jgi:predicted metal-dependent peptidase
VTGGATPELRHKLAAARLWAAQRFPYLASVLFASPVVYRSGTGTVSADRSWRLYVDTDRAQHWPVETLGSMLVLQANHLLRDHAARAEALGLRDDDRDAWTQAADAEINDDLADLLTFPEDDRRVLPDDFDAPRGRLAEEYFEIVRRQARAGDEDAERDGDEAQPDGGTSEAGDGTSSDEQRPSGADAAGDEADEGNGQPGTDQAADQPPDRGSGTDGLPRPDELAQSGPAADDTVPDGTERPPDGIEDSSADLIRRQAAAEIAAEQRRAGDVPAGLVRWAQARLHPKVDWRRVLAAEIRRAVADVRGQVDYSYRRPSRRAGSTPGVVLPALRRPQVEVTVVCDTSASMGQERLDQVLAEVEGLLRSVGIGGLTVLSVDVEVHRARRVQHAGQVELVGGGGTDMGAGIEAARRRRPRPDVIVVLTDGETPWPSRCPPGVRVVVGLLGERAPQGPSWARSVRIDEPV